MKYMENQMDNLNGLGIQAKNKLHDDLEKWQSVAKELAEALSKAEKWMSEFGGNYDVYKQIESALETYKTLTDEH